MLEGNRITKTLRVKHVKENLSRVQKYLRYRRPWGTYRCTCLGLKEVELCLPYDTQAGPTL